MKIFAKGLAFALLAVIAVQLADMDMANAYDENKVVAGKKYESLRNNPKFMAGQKCDWRCRDKHKSCLDRCKKRYGWNGCILHSGRFGREWCGERQDRCLKRCEERHPIE